MVQHIVKRDDFYIKFRGTNLLCMLVTLVTLLLMGSRFSIYYGNTLNVSLFAHNSLNGTQ